MNEALQTLEIKVENNGTTPQGKIFAREWNVLVEAVRALDLKGFDEAKLLQFLRDQGFITSEDIPDVDFSNVVTLSGQQIISGAKDFVGGIKVNGMPITYNAEKKYWEFAGDLIVSGAITMFGSSAGFVPSTIMDSVQVDGVTIVKNTAGQLQAIGGGSGSGGGISAAEVNILIENALKPYIKIETADDKYALISTVSGINSRLSAVETFFATEDSDTLINKWSEIVAFLNATEGDTLDNILATKANQSALDAAVASLTTEIGKKWTQNDAKISNWDSAYGWGDHANAGYAAKTYVDAELAKYVKLATAQSIEAQHNFVNGLQIGGLPITKSASANNTIYLDANLVVSGAITMFGSGSTTFPTIWSQIPFNTTHMKWENGVWNIIGGGSGSVNEATVNNLIYEYLTKNSYARISDISSALMGYATQTWVGDNYLSKSGGTITIDDIAGFTIYRNNGVYSAIHFYNTQDGTKTDVGYLGAASNGRPVYLDAGGSVFDLIHSGNIGSYNAGSATKLATPCTIWGQSFDGSGDVSGILTNVAGIRGSTTNGGYIGDRNEGLGATDGGSMIYNYSASPITFHINGSEYVRILPNGNVAIGATTADAKLHVHGNLLTTGNIEGGIFGLRNSSPDNPLLRLTVGNQNYYVQATSDGVYLGPTSTLSLKVDANGNTTINGNLLTTGVITTPQINIGGLAAYKLQDDTLFIDANVVVRGAFSMFGVNTLAEMESVEQRLLSLEQKVEQLSA